MRKPSLLVIFATVFIDLIGFGIVLPLLPIYSEKFGAGGLMIGCIIGSFSLMQFVGSPWWGRLSDRIGRRPVLLLSNAGSAVSYAMFALAAWPGLAPRTALAVVLASRVFAGACGANISVASAYIADVTPRDQRSKGMALIGVAFGLGFILGPAIGGLSAASLGLAGPGWVAAGLCAANFTLACFILVESRQPGAERAVARPRLSQWAHTLGQPKVGLLVGVYFLSTFCFTCLESTLPLLVGSPSFHPDDFRDAPGLARKLAVPADPVSAALGAKLSPAARLALAHSDQAAGRLRHALFSEFNRLIRDPSLFDEGLRRRMTLRPETEAALKQNLSGAGRMHLNRLLLEEAYPAEIKPQRLYFDERHVGYLFAYCGLVSAFIQGGLIGRLVKRVGEARLIFLSLVVVAVSLTLLPYAPEMRLTAWLTIPSSWPAVAAKAAWVLLDLGMLLLALAMFSAASATNRAPTMGLISLYSPAAEQGATLGVAQSAGTMARIIAPVFATGLYTVYPHSPYLAAAGIALVGAWLAWRCVGAPESQSSPGGERDPGLAPSA